MVTRITENCMTTASEPKPLLRHLRPGCLLNTLAERLAWARLEDFDWTARITVDRRLLDAVFSLDLLNRHDHMFFVGPGGVWLLTFYLRPLHLLAMLSRIEKGTIRFGLSVRQGG